MCQTSLIQSGISVGPRAQGDHAQTDLRPGRAEKSGHFQHFYHRLTRELPDFIRRIFADRLQLGYAEDRWFFLTVCLNGCTVSEKERANIVRLHNNLQSELPRNQTAIEIPNNRR